MSANAGIHIRPNSFRVSSGSQSQNNFIDYRQTLLSSPLAGLTAVGDANMLEHLYQDWINAQPGLPVNAPIVGRISSVEDWLKSVWAKGDAVQTAQDWAKKLYDSVRNSGWFELTRHRIYWQHKDETLGDWEWQVAFEKVALPELLKYGMNYAGLNLFTHNPPMTEYGDAVDGWSILWPAVEAIAAAGDRALISLHTYVDSHLPLDWEHQQYGALRNFYFINKLRRAKLNPRIVLSETGTYYPWKYAKLADYNALANMLEWMFNQYQEYPEVVSLHPYDCSLEEPENWYVPPEEIRMIARYNRENVGTTPVPTPIPTPTPTPTPVPLPVPMPSTVLFNPGFEGITYVETGDLMGARRVPEGWKAWWITRPETSDPHMELEKHPTHVAESTQSFRLIGGAVDGGIYQTFTSEPFAKYGVAVKVKATCTRVVDAPSVVDHGKFLYMVGLDPQGGTDGSAQHIKWVEGSAVDLWSDLITDEIATGEKMTLFLRMITDRPDLRYDTFWDDVRISISYPVEPPLPPVPGPTVVEMITRWESYIRATPELKTNLSNVITTLAGSAKLRAELLPNVNGYVKVYLGGYQVGWIWRNNVIKIAP